MNPLFTLLIRLLEGMFVIGMCGSAVVLLITTVEDTETMLEKDEPAEGKPQAEED
jgi:hypothetical protein